MIDICDSYEHTSNSFFTLLHSDIRPKFDANVSSAALLYEDDRYPGQRGDALIKRAQIGDIEDGLERLQRAAGRTPNSSPFGEFYDSAFFPLQLLIKMYNNAANVHSN